MALRLCFQAETTVPFHSGSLSLYDFHGNFLTTPRSGKRSELGNGVELWGRRQAFTSH